MPEVHRLRKAGHSSHNAENRFRVRCHVAPTIEIPWFRRQPPNTWPMTLHRDRSHQQRERREFLRLQQVPNRTTRSLEMLNRSARPPALQLPEAARQVPDVRAEEASASLRAEREEESRCGATRGGLVPEKGARPDRTTDQGRRPNRAPPPVIRRRFCDGAFPPEQAVRLVTARRISPVATYGCGSAPESDRLPLLRWVKL